MSEMSSSSYGSRTRPRHATVFARECRCKKGEYLIFTSRQDHSKDSPITDVMLVASRVAVTGDRSTGWSRVGCQARERDQLFVPHVGKRSQEEKDLVARRLAVTRERDHHSRVRGVDEKR
ncbi:hypothetical protein QJS10_CPA01g00145 [Acorus calamus]|uniref:Uncharacterized protein n=1 Tax=Acorus calamus TaxID=4465 RepID=A0AAV9FS45_ACOCL|nr:hypothetical protein QJS10_CPA01g00145 [Acorus calamus]